MPDRREYHAHIFDGFQDGSLGVCLLFDTRREWTKAKKDLLAEGFRLKQDAHTEGTLLFAQCLAAIEACCIRRGVVSEAA